MNNFHRFQNFRQFSNLFSQIRLKKRHTSLFSGICREIRTKFHLKNRRKNANFDTKKWKIGNSFFIREKMLTIFGWNFEIEERCKGVHCVDLDESFPTSIYLQNLASIQPRTSPKKFGKMGIWDFEISFAFSPVLAFELTSQRTCVTSGRRSSVTITWYGPAILPLPGARSHEEWWQPSQSQQTFNHSRRIVTRSD